MHYRATMKLENIEAIFGGECDLDQIENIYLDRLEVLGVAIPLKQVPPRLKADLEKMAETEDLDWGGIYAK